MNRVFPAIVRNGSIVYCEPELIKRFLCVNQGKQVEVVIRSPKRSRSNSQNSYYWSVVLTLVSEHTGHTPEELHEHFRARYLAVPTGDFMKWKTKRSSELNTVEFEEYLEKIRMFAGEELNIYIPLPNEIEV